VHGANLAERPYLNNAIRITHPTTLYIGATILSICWASTWVEQTPLCRKNLQKKENHVRSGFCGSVSLIGAITTFWAVGYNGDSTSFVTYLTCLTDIQILTVAVIVMMLKRHFELLQTQMQMHSLLIVIHCNNNCNCNTIKIAFSITIFSIHDYNTQNSQVQYFQFMITPWSSSSAATSTRTRRRIGGWGSSTRAASEELLAWAPNPHPAASLPQSTREVVEKMATGTEGTTSSAA
jgi:hypothetical protein